jgi:hypothetical protein
MTIGETWFRILCLPLIVVVAFGLFCSVLVVALLGYVLPGTTPAAELRTLFGLYARAYRAGRRLLAFEI